MQGSRKPRTARFEAAHPLGADSERMSSAGSLTVTSSCTQLDYDRLWIATAFPPWVLAVQLRKGISLLEESQAAPRGTLGQKWLGFPTDEVASSHPLKNHKFSEVNVVNSQTRVKIDDSTGRQTVKINERYPGARKEGCVSIDMRTSW